MTIICPGDLQNNVCNFQCQFNIIFLNLHEREYRDESNCKRAKIFSMTSKLNARHQGTIYALEIFSPVNPRVGLRSKL